MKSNAPERIYVCDNVFPTHVDWDGSPINTKRIDNHDIEYVRKDAFIEKVCKWLKNNLSQKVSVISSGYVHINFDNAIEEFRKYMEEK